MTAFAVYRFPCGAFRIEEESGYIVSLTLVSSQSPDCGTPSPLTDKTAAQMEEYFHGVRKSFDVPYLLRGTVFQKEVWSELLKIPYGETVSYGCIARRIGMPKAVRAVANANGANPLSVFVPCHRVIGSDRSLTGYGGGIEVKRRLLELEGVRLPGRQAGLS